MRGCPAADPLFSFSTTRALLSLAPEECDLLGADLAAGMILLGYHHRAALRCDWAALNPGAGLPGPDVSTAAQVWRTSLKKLAKRDGRRDPLRVLRRLVSLLPPDLRGKKLDELAPSICPHLGVQVVAYAGASGSKLVYMFPPNPAPDLVPLFFYRGRISGPVGGRQRTLSLIVDHERFFKKGGAECFNHCGRIVKSLSSHKCRRGHFRSCFVCCGLRLARGAEVYEDAQTQRYYCRPPPETDGSVKCDRCGMVAESEACLTRHRRNRRCGLGKICEVCKSFVFGGKDGESSHVCGKVRCKHCFDYHEKDDAEHQCKMDMSCRQPKLLPRLAFYDFETSQDDSSRNCFDCFALERQHLREHGRMPARAGPEAR